MTDQETRQKRAQFAIEMGTARGIAAVWKQAVIEKGGRCRNLKPRASPARATVARLGRL